MVRTHIVGALGAASLLLMTGCSSGSTAATPTTSSTTSPAPSSSSSTVKPSSPTPKPTPKGDPNVPPAARAHTKAGAKAFVVAYMDAVNATGQRPRVGVLEPLALASCKTCNKYEDQVKELVKSHTHYAGPLGTYRVKDPSLYAATSASVYLEIKQEPIALLTSKGETTDRLQRQSITAKFALKWVTDRWKVAKFYAAS